MEGTFESYFKNRILNSVTISLLIFRKSQSNGIVVIADGDIGKNWFTPKGEMIPMGTDQYTNRYYDNKKFLINCANYLLNDHELIAVRSKKIKMRLLDSKLVQKNKSLIQVINIGLPIIVIVLISLVFIVFRKFRFSTK